MSEKVIFNLYTGNYCVNFDNEDEYNIYLNQKSKFKKSIIACLLLALLMLISFILIFVKNILIIMFGISFLAFLISTKVYNSVEQQYNSYKYDLILRDIKKNNYRIKYSNDRTGHISYVKDGVGFSIYVFKGKNAKGAR